jgi:glyoxylase-like metal-dependent hydrolase (beta-lactamase superfamily II)
VQAYNAQTFILRENLSETREAPFLYLLVGRQRALLIDTGDVADAGRVPLEATVQALLPGQGHSKLPLVVVHSHGHLDHRLGDGQFANRAGVEVVPADLASVQRYFGLPGWPEGIASLDLGERIIDVLPAPGHHPAHVLFYDRTTGLLFSGDFLLPGRLLVDDLSAYRASAQRVTAYLKDRPVAAVLGGHIEKNATGSLFSWQAKVHPDEHALALTKADLLALPAALQSFHGLYAESGAFVVENPLHLLLLSGAALLLAVVGLVVVGYRFFRRRR